MKATKFAFLCVFLSGCMSTSDPTLRGLPRGLYTITDDRTILIRGVTMNEIAQSLEQSVAAYHSAGEIGFTDYAFDWDLQPEEHMGTCRVGDLRVQLNLVFSQPEWKDQHKAGQEVRGAWDAYRKQLFSHEEGHRTLAVAMGKEMVSRLNRLRESSCQALVDHANRIVQETHSAYAARHLSYDRNSPPILWPPQR